MENHLVACRTLYGETKRIPAQKLHFRPSAYAIIVHGGAILLMKMRSRSTYCLPGGGIELGETIEQALQREVREEAGIAIEVLQFHHFKEDFFYYDPLDIAFHSYRFFYLCKPLTFDLLPDDLVEDDEAESPRWVAIDGLAAQDFYVDGEEVLRIVGELKNAQVA